MNIFLDTNVVMDYLASRGDLESVRRIFRQIEMGEHVAYISIGSFYTITYLTEIFLKNQGFINPERTERLRDILESLLSYVHISGHTKEELLRGVKDAEFTDLEDSYQYQAALTSKCEYLITSNIKDFCGIEYPSLEILLPKDFE